ncbi:flp/Fap pilin component family protein [Sphingobium sp. RAC03]|jgi:pilus assembly protein Flp/PilA|nr:flp/Fap pilin component family protein [Sphingobium sp. RAC03]
MRGLSKIIDRLQSLRCERAATTIEYAFILAMITLLIMVAVESMANNTTSMWNNMAEEVNAI